MLVGLTENLIMRNTVGDLLRRTADRHPDKVGMVFRDIRKTYAQFNEDVNRFANAVSALGIGKGDKLALLSHNCYQYAVIYFALAKLGAVLVPINFMLRPSEVGYIVDHSESKAFFVEDAMAGAAAEVLTHAPKVRQVGVIRLAEAAAPTGWLDYDALVAQGSPAEPLVEIDDGEVAQIAYTSGTESLPKGAMLTHRGLIAQYMSIIADGEFNPGEVIVHALPLYHCAQLHVFFTPGVAVGATNIIIYAPTPDEILGTVEREGVTLLFCPPTVWIALLRSPAFGQRDLASLRKGYYGAAIMPVEVLKELASRLPRCRLWNLYGQTEMGPLATTLRPEDQLRKPGSAGKPALQVETILVDDDNNPVAVGQVGEIVHRSPHVMLGYFKDEAKTLEAFRGGWFHSGDLGVMDEEGYITVVDRKKDMIKSGGENVASREVEEAIYLDPRVSEVAVIGIPHPYWIEAVAAVVVPKAGATLTADEVTGHCRAHLSKFKVPKYVVIAPNLPRNPSGKILKRELRQAYQDLPKADA